MKVHEVLRTLRRNRNLSQENVANDLDLDLSTYGGYEKDAGKVQVKLLEKFAFYYGMSFEELINYKGTYDLGIESTVIHEASTPYLPIKKEKAVKILIELDGMQESLKNWFSKLEKINNSLAV